MYCHANYSYLAVEINSLKHNPGADILIGAVKEDEKITLRKMQSYKLI